MLIIDLIYIGNLDPCWFTVRSSQKNKTDGKRKKVGRVLMSFQLLNSKDRKVAQEDVNEAVPDSLKPVTCTFLSLSLSVL